jgi:hypothetical protein
LEEDTNQILDDHRAAIKGWKARKEQLHRQQESVWKANDEAESVDLISLYKKKAGKDI